jgi:putative membrane protein
MIDYLLVALKGAAMGAANVIPGVSGGTIAFVTGIYERLINAIKACGPKALKLLLGRKFGEFARHVDLWFLAAIAIGAVASILALAGFLKDAFKEHPVPTWAFFFGLILASIWGVGKMVKRWGPGTLLALLLGLAAAIGLLFLPHGSGNEGFVFLIACGAVAISSMIIPGVSGSFVLLVMGNYALVLGAVSSVKVGLKAFISSESPGLSLIQFHILIPFAIGCVLGLALLSNILSWIFRRHHDIAVALITGFIAGSLVLIWPWKDDVYKKDDAGAYIVKTEDRKLEARAGSIEKVSKNLKAEEELLTIGYENWHAPPMGDKSTIPAIVLALGGAALVFLIEWLGAVFGRRKSV